MTDKRRDPLPDGYQFGDAARTVVRRTLEPWRCLLRGFCRASDRRAENVAGRMIVFCGVCGSDTSLADWNVIEGEQA